MSDDGSEPSTGNSEPPIENNEHKENEKLAKDTLRASRPIGAGGDWRSDRFAG